MNTPITERSSDVTEPNSLAHRFHVLHLAEKFYAVGVFSLTAIQIVRSDAGLMHFLALWAIVAAASLFAAIWPRTPRAVALLGEAFLTLLAAGHWIAGNPHWLPMLNRFSIVSDDVPLIQRRLIAWNMIGGLTLAWMLVPYCAIVLARPRWRTWSGILGIIGIFLVSLLMLFLFGIIAMTILSL